MKTYDTWGKLKSGLGWINLSDPGMKFVEYVEEEVQFQTKALLSYNRAFV